MDNPNSFSDRLERSVAQFERDDKQMLEFEDTELSGHGDQERLTHLLLEHEAIALPRQFFPRRNPLDANMTPREFR